MAAGPRDYFLSNLSRWEFDVPYSTQWVVHISPKAGLGNFLSNIQTSITVDHSRFILDPDLLAVLFGSDVQSQRDGLGLYFAQSMSTPSEGFSVNDLSLGEGSGGFMPGMVGSNRKSPTAKSINIDFLETNIDFIDGIMRPWIITASYLGLIELDSASSIKANIDIVQYTKGMNRPVRKIHSFHGCVPFEVQEGKLDYDQEKVTVKTVGWVYNHYTYKIMSGQESGIPIGDIVSRPTTQAIPVAVPLAVPVAQTVIPTL